MIFVEQPAIGPGEALVRVVFAATFAGVVAGLDRPAALGAAVVLAIIALGVGKVGLRQIAGRLVALEALVLLAVLTLPFGGPGVPVFTWGPLVATQEGLGRAADLGMSASAVALMLLAVVAPLGPGRLGSALGRLGVPARLVHLLLLMVRYLEVIAAELARVRAAQKLRGFRPGANRHTVRTLGYLVGMSLVRALERAERVHDAMRCRGFSGVLVAFDAPSVTRREVGLAVAGGAALVGLVLLELGSGEGWPWLR